jgi:transcriptional regulator with XRE-family HTH domain
MEMLRLRLWRLAAGLTQAQAARHLGMSHLTLGYLESGRLAASERDLERLRAVFGDRAERMFDEVGDGLEVAP